LDIPGALLQRTLETFCGAVMRSSCFYESCNSVSFYFDSNGVGEDNEKSDGDTFFIYDYFPISLSFS